MSELADKPTIDREQVLTTIRDHAAGLRAERDGGVPVRLGEARPESDIDLLIEVKRPFGFLRSVRLSSTLKKYSIDRSILFPRIVSTGASATTFTGSTSVPGRGWRYRVQDIIEAHARLMSLSGG